jgi:hypothetical protein
MQVLDQGKFVRLMVGGIPFNGGEDGMSTLDDYTVEIDETDRQRVVLILPELRLIVLGQTLAEARALANAAITFSGARTRPAALLTRGTDDDQDGDRPTPHSETALAA